MARLLRNKQKLFLVRKLLSSRSTFQLIVEYNVPLNLKIKKKKWKTKRIWNNICKKINEVCKQNAQIMGIVLWRTGIWNINMCACEGIYDIVQNLENAVWDNCTVSDVFHWWISCWFSLSSRSFSFLYKKYKKSE